MSDEDQQTNHRDRSRSRSPDQFGGRHYSLRSRNDRNRSHRRNPSPGQSHSRANSENPSPGHSHSRANSRNPSPGHSHPKAHNPSESCSSGRRSPTDELSTMLVNAVHCPVCLQVFDNPKILSCLHTVCQSCLAVLTNNLENVSCPKCRSVSEVSNIRSDFRTNEQVAMFVKLKNENKGTNVFEDGYFKKCDLCEERATMMYCNECSKYMCRTCCKGHVKLSNCSPLSAVSIEERLSHMKETLCKSANDLKAMPERLLELKREQQQSIAAEMNQCLENLEKSKAKLIGEVMSSYSQLTATVKKASDVALKELDEQYNQMQHSVQKHADEIADIQPHVLLGTFDALTSKIESSLSRMRQDNLPQLSLTLVKQPSHIEKAPLVEVKTMSTNFLSGAKQCKSSGVIGFKISKVSHLGDLADSVISPAYQIGGMPWRVLIKLSEMESTKSLGMFLECVSPTDVEWLCRASAVLRLVAQKEGCRHLCLEYRDHLFHSKARDWGYLEFIRWDKLLDSSYGFVVDDCLIVEAHITVNLSDDVDTQDE